MIELRNVELEDFSAILAFNRAEEQQTSAMDGLRLHELHRISAYHKVALVDGAVAAFLLAMREGSPYPNDNYGFFSSRFATFFYVDRIVVAAEFAGRGVGKRLYTDLFDVARHHGVSAIVCEYNIEPPNPTSKAFHDRFGFSEIGRQRIANGAKEVSMQSLQL
jgi:uncharacterized protein